MNTQFIRRAAKKHGNRVAWSSVALAFAGLIAQAISQHVTSGENHSAIWGRITMDEARIAALEKKEISKDAYEKGLQDGKNSNKKGR